MLHVHESHGGSACEISSLKMEAPLPPVTAREGAKETYRFSRNSSYKYDFIIQIGPGKM